MESEKLVGRRVHLLVSEPWDFTDRHGAGPFEAVVEGASKAALLLRLKTPLEFKGTCEYFHAAPRFADDDFCGLMLGQRVTAALTRVTADAVAASTGLDVSKWRGGVGLIGTLEC